jgi:glycosyltransferase involved in cell wall biosynthesis
VKVAIFESILTPGGHEIDFDRLLVDELRNLEIDVSFYVPEGYRFKYDYGVPVRYLPGRGVSYEGVRGIRKLWRAAKRECNRQRWFKALYQHGVAGDVDAIIIPTATYRYLRALDFNMLKKSPIPIIFIVHGVNPKEAPSFFRQVEKLKKYDNIKIAVLTLGKNILGQQHNNVHCLKPPTFIPRDIDYKPTAKTGNTLKLGFFGQYRKEKNLDAFLDAFLSCKFPPTVELFVQGATVKPEDAADFQRIQKKYENYSQIEFLHKALIGQEWQAAIASVDALIMPYASSRYKYHWGGMFFTAIGFHKPVVIAEDVNPEVLAQYDIGVHCSTGDHQALNSALEHFVTTYDDKSEIYRNELQRANHEFAPSRMVEQLLTLGRG